MMCGGEHRRATTDGEHKKKTARRRKTLFMKIRFWFFTVCCSFSHTRKFASPNSHSWSLCWVFRFSDGARRKKRFDDVILAWEISPCHLVFMRDLRACLLIINIKQQELSFVVCTRAWSSVYYPNDFKEVIKSWVKSSSMSTRGLCRIIIKTVRGHHWRRHRGLPGKFILTMKILRERILSESSQYLQTTKSSSSVEKKQNRKSQAEKLCNVWENCLSTFEARTDVVVRERKRIKICGLRLLYRYY